MSWIAIVLLVIKIIMKLPALFSVGMQILALMKKFKDGDLWSDLQVIGEILLLILGLIASDREKASNAFKGLKPVLQTHTVSINGEVNTALLNYRDTLKLSL